MTDKLPLKFFVIGRSTVSFKTSQLIETSSFNEADFALLTGGCDISPALYGQQSKGSYGCNKHRDHQEIAAIANCLLEDTPVVGICRGAQLLHVYEGGTLIQDIATRHPQVHSIRPANGDASLSVKVNSHHHQGVPLKEALDRYECVYTDEQEEVAEVFIDPDKQFLGFQYHPEYSTCPQPGIELFVKTIRFYIG